MSPRTKEQIALLRADRKETILMAALERFANQGYHSTSVSDIARQAGISKGLIYNYYDSKEALLTGLLERLMEDGDEYREAMQQDDPKVALHSLFTLFKENLINKKELWRLAISLSVQKEVGNFDFMKENMRHKIEAILLVLEQLLGAMKIDRPKEEALAIGAILDGISLQYVVAGENYPLEDLVNYLIEKYCR